MQKSFYCEINGLFSKVIVHVVMDALSRFRRDTPTLNSFEFSRYLRMDFKYILNKIHRQNVAKSLIRIPSLVHYFFECCSKLCDFMPVASSSPFTQLESKVVC